MESVAMIIRLQAEAVVQVILQILLLVAAAGGTVLAIKARDPGQLFLVVSVAAIFSLHLLYFGAARFQLPIIPFVYVLASLGVDAALVQLRRTLAPAVFCIQP